MIGLRTSKGVAGVAIVDSWWLSTFLSPDGCRQEFNSAEGINGDENDVI